MLSRFLRVPVVVVMSSLPLALAAQVVPDGGSATSVQIGADGSVTVGIAPASRDGISHNTYRDFNANKAGVDLDNRREAARTIVNEVTGTSRSEINGPVEVLGQRAHVIIANPNGISVDGGRFVNTGRTALTTGDISINAREIAPGIFQENVVSNVRGGTIEIRGGGLAGQMDAVDLIAHSVKVDGTVDNESGRSLSAVNIVAGQTRTEFDSSLVPGNIDRDWASVTGIPGASDDGILVEITAQGALRANRVEVQISDRGAGMRYAGSGLATSRNFVLSADGTINLGGADIRSAGNARISGRDVALGQSRIEVGSGSLEIKAVDTDGAGITGSDVLLSADEILLMSAADILFDAKTRGGSRLISDVGQIGLFADGSVSDQRGEWDSTGGTSVFAGADIAFSETVSFAGADLAVDAGGMFRVDGSELRAASDVLLGFDEAKITNKSGRSEIVANAGSLVLTSRGERSDGDVLVEGALLQGAVLRDGVSNPAGTEAEGAVTIDVAGALRTTTVGDDLAVLFSESGDLVVRTGANVENMAGRYVSNGDIRVVAEGDVLNMIELPDGSNDPTVTRYTRKGSRKWWTLWMKRKRTTHEEYDFGYVARPDQLATMTAAGSLELSSGGLILNQGGEMNANGGDLTLAAVRVETIGVGSGRALVRKVCVLTCEYEGSGDIKIYGGALNAAKDVNISASASVLNKGGQILALQNVTIDTPEAQFEAVLVPTVVNRPKGLYNFWASDGAWMYLRDRFGGVIAGSGNISLNTRDAVKLLGAELTAGEQVVSEASVQTVYGPRAISPVYGDEIGLFHDIPPVSFE
ncbi:filamentous hemagglutinin N-terminal domain-containing protein [Palleronia caenipelagi]|uniref:Filamentous hemagglutinin N-terminal domain-containing protein n=1 Tax=Palleronia caenipelagi TaxID=2489174 RepID=A0A547PMJ1_9RHOB|nr:filamentous hemagglutinin N-terminal domain-containing protein [Palleronia caenipelagi]TRD15369.1 filamentous hemagglutinin N-terminal domain-containing protein [Palleronia caenipelagi]